MYSIVKIHQCSPSAWNVLTWKKVTGCSVSCNAKNNVCRVLMENRQRGIFINKKANQAIKPNHIEYRMFICPLNMQELLPSPCLIFKQAFFKLRKLYCLIKCRHLSACWMISFMISGSTCGSGSCSICKLRKNGAIYRVCIRDLIFDTCESLQSYNK